VRRSENALAECRRVFFSAACRSARCRRAGGRPWGMRGR